MSLTSVPSAQVQRPTIANPPTHVLAVQNLLHVLNRTQMTAGGPGRHPTFFLSFLRHVVPAVHRHVQWFLRTQASDRPDSFRWHERTVAHCLSSGLDDYPRAEYLSSREGHVDLQSWMIMLCETMRDVTFWLANDSTADAASRAYYSAESAEYQQRAVGLRSVLDELHWNAKRRRYQDYSFHPNTSRKEFTDHFGYVSLFPLLLRLIDPASPKLEAVLQQLSDPRELWSRHGIRSLSVSDPSFGKEENYWRGAIWLNINYLTVSALHHYATRDGPYRQRASQLYQQLRANLVRTVFSQYQQTGYLWEQYDPASGKGRRSHPFTGWTSLIVLIMGEMFVS